MNAAYKPGAKLFLRVILKFRSYLRVYVLQLNSFFYLVLFPFDVLQQVTENEYLVPASCAFKEVFLFVY